MIRYDMSQRVFWEKKIAGGFGLFGLAFLL